jgi:DNA-binding NtrC family response regulator
MRTVLVVHTGDTVGGPLRRTLESFGFEVIEVSGFAAALDSIRRRRGLDVLVCNLDSRDGDISSEELAEAFLVESPEGKVLYVSCDRERSARDDASPLQRHLERTRVAAAVRRLTHAPGRSRWGLVATG